MTRITIKKGRHYPYLIPIVFPFCVKKNDNNFRTAEFMFTESCMFDLHDEDQWDVNKLFGFSIGHHQRGSSFRFGWRPILNENLIEIVGYEYHDGIRQKTMPICKVKLYKWHKFIISYNNETNKSIYFVNNIKFVNDVNLIKKSGLGYTLGVYFGGNEKAPQDITIFKKLR
jgi:hypothetical protein